MGLGVPGGGVKPHALREVERPASINAYNDYLAIVFDGKPVRFFWTAAQKRHVLVDLARIVASDLENVK